MFIVSSGWSTDDEDVVAKLKIAVGVSLALALAGCGQGQGGNVMAPEANALTAEQVDLALGPELTNTADNELGSANGTNVVAAENAVEAADTEDAIDEAVTDEPPVANTDTEQ